MRSFCGRSFYGRSFYGRLEFRGKMAALGIGAFFAQQQFDFLLCNARRVLHFSVEFNELFRVYVRAQCSCLYICMCTSVCNRIYLCVCGVCCVCVCLCLCLCVLFMSTLYICAGEVQNAHLPPQCPSRCHGSYHKPLYEELCSGNVQCSVVLYCGVLLYRVLRCNAFSCTGNVMS